MICRLRHYRKSRRLRPVQLYQLTGRETWISRNRYLVSGYAHTVKLLLVICAGLGAVVRYEDELFTCESRINYPSFYNSSRVFREGATYPSSVACQLSPRSLGICARRTTARLSFSYHQHIFRSNRLWLWSIRARQGSLEQGRTRAYHRNRKGRPRTLLDTYDHQCLGVLGAYIELVHESINRGFVPGKILRRGTRTAEYIHL